MLPWVAPELPLPPGCHQACSMLTLAPLFPTSPGRPRVPSGPGSPCEKGKIFLVSDVSNATCVNGSVP